MLFVIEALTFFSIEDIQPFRVLIETQISSSCTSDSKLKESFLFESYAIPRETNLQINWREK